MNLTPGLLSPQIVFHFLSEYIPQGAFVSSLLVYFPFSSSSSLFFFLLLLLLLSLIVLFYPLPPLFLSFLIPSSFTEGEGETEQASLTYLFLLIMKLTNTPPTHTQELSCPYGLIEQVYQPHMLLRRPSRYLSLGERP